MDSSTSSHISRRLKKSSSLPDLRKTIAYKKYRRLKHYLLCVIGAEGTGRHTMVRRFLDMSSGPFQQPEPEDKKRRGRSVLVDLWERPSLLRPEIIDLCVFFFNSEQLDFEAIYLTVPQVKSNAVVFDVGHRHSLFTAIHCMIRLTVLLDRNAPRFILVGNKIDLPEHEVWSEEGANVAARCKAERYFECSALMNVKMDPVLDTLLLLALHPERPLPQLS